ncbi:MAG: hypothetical protein L0Z62_10430 [Gemmataceae bacterium]|nr:hypothetical protein [Gemmataceae bacterium]
MRKGMKTALVFCLVLGFLGFGLATEPGKPAGQPSKKPADKTKNPAPIDPAFWLDLTSG